MPGGEKAGEDEEPADEIANWPAEMEREAEFDAVGEQGALRPRFEDMVMAPKCERAMHTGVDEKARVFHGFPTSRPSQSERPLTDCDGKFPTGSRGMLCADFEDAHPGRGNAPEIVRILVEKEKFLWRGGQKARAGEDGHEVGNEGSLAGRVQFSLLHWVRFANKRFRSKPTISYVRQTHRRKSQRNHRQRT